MCVVIANVHERLWPLQRLDKSVCCHHAPQERTHIGNEDFMLSQLTNTKNKYILYLPGGPKSKILKHLLLCS